MSDGATRRTRTSWLGPMLAVAALLGGALTAYGWFTRGEDWRTAAHLDYFAGFLVFVLAGLGLGAFRRWRALPTGVVAAVVMAAAFGQLGALATVAWFALSCVLLGRLVLRRWPEVGDVECALVGMVGYGTVVGLLVAWPVNYTGVYALLLALPPLLARAEAATLAARVRGWFAAERSAGAVGWLEEGVGAAVAAIALVHMLVAAMPETGHDALVSHLMMPARIAFRGVWEFDVTAHAWAVMPALGDWLYTVGYMLAGESGARFVNVACVLLLGRVVFDTARWIGGGRAAALAAVLLFLTTPLALTETSSLFIEGAWSCCVVGAAMAVLRAVSSGTPEGMRSCQLVVAGLLAGGGMAAKMVTMLALPWLGLLLLVRWRSWWSRQRPAMVAAVLAFAVVGCQPYVRALWRTGNPVFPFFNARFRSPYYPPEDFVAPVIFDHGVTWDVLYRMTFDSGRYLEALPGAAGFQWLLLVVPAVLGFAWVGHRRALVLAGFATATLVLVFAQTAYLRYVFPTFAIASALAGAALAGALPRTRGGLFLTAGAVVAVVLNLVCFSAGGYNHHVSIRALVDRQAMDRHFAERQPLRVAIRLVNQLNRGMAPVALFGPAMAADLHADVLTPNWYNPTFALAVRGATTPDALGELLASRRVRHLLLAASWQDEPSRERVRAVSHEVHTIGDVSVRVLDERFRFRRELLRAGRFEDPAAWGIDAGARLEPGRGVVVHVAAPAVQRVEVIAGREYCLRAEVLRVDPMTPVDARLQINWIGADGGLVHCDIQVFACQAEATTPSMDVVAPPGAVAALVYATGHSTNPVLFAGLSFRQ